MNTQILIGKIHYMATLLCYAIYCTEVEIYWVHVHKNYDGIAEWYLNDGVDVSIGTARTSENL